MNRRRQVTVGDRRGGGFDRNDPMGRVGITGFSAMDLARLPQLDLAFVDFSLR